VRFELTDQTRSAIDDYLRLTGRKPGQILFCGRDPSRGLTTRQYARLVNDWVASIGLDPPQHGTRSLRRTKAVLIYGKPVISVRYNFFSEWLHTAHEQPAEARIAYRYHPRFGEVVQIRRRLECGGVEFVVVLQPDGSFASLPAWMTEPAASRFEICYKPHFPLHILRSMRAEADALLGFLRSESKTETADHAAPIKKPPAKPIRRGDAAREAVSGSQGRTCGPRGSSAPRDRSDAGQRKKRGGRP
jgi:hypothetical protein